MHRHLTFLQSSAVLIFVLASLPAHSALINRGGGMLFDDVLNVTWLSDANYAKTSGYDADGRMTLNEANTWASNLSYGGYNDWRLPSSQSLSITWNHDIPIPGQRTGIWGEISCANCTISVPAGNYTYDWAGNHNELSYMYYLNLGLHSWMHYYETTGINPIFGSQSNSKGNVGLVTNLQFDDLSASLGTQRYANYWFNDSLKNHLFEEDGISEVYQSILVFGTETGGNGRSVPAINTGNYAWALRDGDVSVSAVPAPAAIWLFASGLGVLGLAKRKKR